MKVNYTSYTIQRVCHSLDISIHDWVHTIVDGTEIKLSLTKSRTKHDSSRKSEKYFYLKKHTFNNEVNALSS